MVCLFAASCGSTSSTPTTPITPAPSGPVTVTFSGTTTQSAVNACGGDSHNFNAASGDITVKLLETTDPAAALSIQVCPGGIDAPGTCTLQQQKILVGQSLTGARKGIATQNLKLLPHSCVFTSTVNTTPVTYKVSVTYEQ
jgi:hypothetical protein